MSIGIPYKGSKRKIAKPIVDYIQMHNPNGVYLYDLFGGGGAISFEALKRKHFKGVFYNEFNTGVVELLKHIRKQGITPKMYEWVDRQTFEKHKNDNDWYGGFLKTCWSFGSNQKNYLFGKEIEEDKRLLHEIVVNNCEVSRLEFFNKYGIDPELKLIDSSTVNNRRLNLQKLLSTLSKEHKEKLSHFCIADKTVRGISQHLQRVEILKKVKQDSHNTFQRITNLSYEQVPLTTPIEQTIIYCDPPYKGTAKYQKDIDHELFYNWVKNSPYKVYVSSYYFDLPMVMQLEHRSTLSATANNRVIEKLFCNQEEKIKLTLF